MGKFKELEDIQAWQKSRELTRDIYQISLQPPLSRDFSLRDQIRRSSRSIMANIAERIFETPNKDLATTTYTLTLTTRG